MRRRCAASWVLAVAGLLSAAAVSGAAPPENGANVRVGVYYFPGWKDFAEPSRPYPWKPIELFPERKPLLGWYQEGDDGVTQVQLEWMANHQIDYVIYDWYLTKGGRPRLSQAIDSYIRLKDNHGRKFSIMWANHNEVPLSKQQFEEMIDFWVERYFADPRYERVGDRPLVIIFSPAGLDARARKFGSSAADLLKLLREKTLERMHVEPYVVAATHAVAKRVNAEYFQHGYDAYTGYNYQYGVEGIFLGAKYSHSYEELTDGYFKTWRWMFENSRLPYIPPLTAGWDRRPWGGSTDPLHDQSYGSPATFEKHVSTALSMILENRDKSLGRMHICCWNEYGEGSYIEPTEGHQFTMLNAIKRGLTRSLKK